MVTSNPALDTLGGYPLARLQDLAGQLRADGQPLHDFSIGDPDEPTPPLIRQALIDAVGSVSRYPTAAGQPALREAVARWFRRRHGVEVDPDEHVLPSAGSKEAIFHLPLAVLDPNGPKRHVLWGDPGYPVYGRGATFAGGLSDPVTLTADDGWRLDLAPLAGDRLGRACLAWINHPHNPTGATTDLAALPRPRSRWPASTDMLLASDECYQELWFDEPAPSVLEATDDDLTGVLAFVSLSKRSGMTGYRSGAIDRRPRADRPAPARCDRTSGPPRRTSCRPPRPPRGTTRPTSMTDARCSPRSGTVVLPFLRGHAGIEVSGSQATFYVWFRAARR
jgi:aspartate/methionine/tyrosine aminotransferase